MLYKHQKIRYYVNKDFDVNPWGALVLLLQGECKLTHTLLIAPEVPNDFEFGNINHYS